MTASDDEPWMCPICGDPKPIPSMAAECARRHEEDA